MNTQNFTTTLSVNETPEAAHETSPIAHLSGNRVPFYVTWGENDSVTCKAQGPAFTMAATITLTAS